MITDLLPWIKDGISIDKRRDGGYKVFTIPTQHFDVDTLEDLTPERFAFEEDHQKKYYELVNEYFNLKNK
jgi:hypothetical protein